MMRLWYETIERLPLFKPNQISQFGGAEPSLCQASNVVERSVQYLLWEMEGIMTSPQEVATRDNHTAK